MTASILDRMPTLTGAEIVAHLVPPPQFANATIDSYRPDRDYPVAGRGGRGDPQLRGGLAPQGRSVQAPPAGDQAGHLPRRRIRRRQDPPAGRAVAPRAGPEVLRHVHRVHRAGRRGRLREHREAAQRRVAGRDRRVRARRPGRHAAHVAAAVRAGRRRDRGSPRPPTPRRTPSARAGSRRRTSCGRSMRSPRSSRWSRIDGVDYRHRDIEGHARTVDAVDAATVDTLDPFDGVVGHLSKVHPSRYVRLIDGLDSIGLTGVHPFKNQTDALRFVAFVDRLYDAQVAIVASGHAARPGLPGRHARRRVPQEVSARDLAPHRAHRTGRRLIDRYRSSCRRRHAIRVTPTPTTAIRARPAEAATARHGVRRPGWPTAPATRSGSTRRPPRRPRPAR